MGKSRKGKLQWISGEALDEEYLIEDGQTIWIGRGSSCDIRMEGAEIAQYHLGISFDAEKQGFWLLRETEAAVFLEDGRSLTVGKEQYIPYGIKVYVGSRKNGFLLAPQKTSFQKGKKLACAAAAVLVIGCSVAAAAQMGVLEPNGIFKKASAAVQSGLKGLDGNEGDSQEETSVDKSLLPKGKNASEEDTEAAVELSEGDSEAAVELSKGDSEAAVESSEGEDASADQAVSTSAEDQSTEAASSTDSDLFISNAGIFEYMSRPWPQPIDEDEITPADGWIGTFYAPGTGLEIRITKPMVWTKETDLDFIIYNYNASSGKTTLAQAQLEELADGSRKSYDEELTFGSLQDGSFTVEFSDDLLQACADRSCPVYMNQKSVTFTDVSILMENAGEDEWGGAYFHDLTEMYGDVEVYADSTIYWSFVSLYGSGDYYIVQQSTTYNTEDEGYTTWFMTQSDGALIQEQTGGTGGIIPEGETWLVFKLTMEEENGQKIVRSHVIWQNSQDSGEYTDYYRCSSKPMWGDS